MDIGFDHNIQRGYVDADIFNFSLSYRECACVNEKETSVRVVLCFIIFYSTSLCKIFED